MKEGSQRIETYTKDSFGENVQPRVSLLSVSMRSYGQNKTIHILYVSLWDPIKACVQNGISGSYIDAVFELVVHEQSEI